MPKIHAERRQGVGGWLLVLCVLLLAWEPVQLGLVASHALASLSARGLPLGVLLLVRILVAAFGIAAGLALATERDGAVLMARASLVLSAATGLIVDATPYFPSNRMPGDTAFHVVGSLAYCATWLAYLARSARVKNTFPGFHAGNASASATR